MFQRSTHIDTEELLLRHIHNAGYKHPTLLQKAVLPLTLQNRDLVVEAGPGEGRTGLLIISLLMQMGSEHTRVKSLILTSSGDEVTKVIRQFRRFSAKHHDKPHIAGLGTEDGISKELRLLARHPGIVVGTTERIIDHIRRGNMSLADVEHVILLTPDDIALKGFDKDVLFIYSKLADKRQTQLYASRLETMSVLNAILRRPALVTKADWCRPIPESGKKQKEEKSQMSKSVKDKAHVDYIKSILKKIKEDESPAELNELRRTLRKHVPLHLRAYFLAYLLKEALKTGGGTTGSLTTLFVSIGRNRKVFPKDLGRLFSEKLSLRPGEMGNIKILDNYSFVEIAESSAQEAIDKLNNTEFRGRKIAVNFARKKGDNRA